MGGDRDRAEVLAGGCVQSAAVFLPVIPCSGLAQESHNIIEKRVALGAEQSVSVGRVTCPGMEDTMTLYVIRGDRVTAHISPPATISEGELVVQSLDDIEASGLSKAGLTAIWNALPGATKLAKFKDRKAAAQRLWAAFAELPVDPQRVGSPSRTGSKQAQIIDLFRRAEGATVAEVIAATGWQPHTVRGIVSGTLKKKLGLTVISAKEERGRVYRIPAQAAV
jgi:hypothetical protein